MTDPQASANSIPSKARIAIADDEESMRHYLRRSLSRRGFSVEVASSGQELLTQCQTHRFDISLVDLKMPGMDGIEVLAQLRASDPEAMVILMTGFGTIRSAVQAMKEGAYDYITKPFELDELLLLIERALSQRETLRENRELRQFVQSRSSSGVLIGQSKAMRAVYETIDLVKETDSTVLIHGESGTGKELVAREIHRRSKPSGEFVPVHCAALPSTLIESELFGHEIGAFTGAHRRKRGLIERADRGTLFLDEVSEIPLEAQVKFLRFLQERVFSRLGSTESREVEVRIIAASNRLLEEEVTSGRFREDLFYRLNVVPLHLPPLRERREDIPVLIAHFLRELGDKFDFDPPEFSPESILALSNSDWPGNVRELENTVERLVVLHQAKPRVVLEDLPSRLRKREDENAVAKSSEDIRGTTDPRSNLETELSPYRDALEQFEKDYLIRLIKASNGNISQAARKAGLSRPSLHRKLNQLGLDVDRFRD